MSKLRSIAWLVGAVSIAAGLNGCDGSSSPTSPSGLSTPSTPSTPTTATITITDAGVGLSPTPFRISVGQQVRIVNNGSSNHQLQSNPHPAHTDCLPMNQLGLLTQGQSGLTGVFTVSRTCGFHDHLNPVNGNFQGNVLVE